MPLILMLQSVFASKRQRVALQHRQNDYLQLLNKRDDDLLAFHLRINQHLDAGQRNWKSYDYGEGYFYQSCPEVGISGFRDTAGRVKAMDLKNRVAGKTVLEIGSNTGFISVAIAPDAKQVTGFDIGPHLIDISNETAQYLNLTNTKFECCTFEEFKTEQKFDIVLSFANHSTYDGNSTLELSTFFKRCHELLVSDGLLLFESHPPGLENAEQVEATCRLIAEDFDILSREVLSYGSFLDQNRTFLVGQKK